MIQKSRFGKRMMAFVLSTALIFSNALPTMAAENKQTVQNNNVNFTLNCSTEDVTANVGDTFYVPITISSETAMGGFEGEINGAESDGPFSSEFLELEGVDYNGLQGGLASDFDGNKFAYVFNNSVKSGSIKLKFKAIKCSAQPVEVKINNILACDGEGSSTSKIEDLIATITIEGHGTTEVRNQKAATCTEKGYTGDTYCTVCGEKVTAGTEIPATGHRATEVRNQKEAACIEKGYTGDTYCTVCNEMISAGTATSELGHSFTDWTNTVAPTALENGKKTRTCTRCGQSEQQDIAKLPATGTLSLRNFPLKVKQSCTLKVDGMATGDRVVSWQSNNTKIATVNSAGKVTGKKKGNAKITATLASGLTLTTTVKVQTGTVKTTSITVNTKNVTLKTKQGFQILATRNPATSQQGITYSTSNKKIATVNKKGYITGVKAGTATITVKSGSKSVKIKVKVEGVKTTGLKANRTEITLKKNKSFSWKVTTVPSNSSEKITYSTSNKKVATVSSSGKIKAKKKGTATITAKSGSKKITIKVTVK